MQEQKSLPPQSVCDGSSPLDTLRAENRTLRELLTRARKTEQMKVDTRVLDLQLRLRNYKQFLQEKGLLEELNTRYNY